MRKTAVIAAMIAACSVGVAEARGAAALTGSSTPVDRPVHIGEPFVVTVEARLSDAVVASSVVIDLDPGPFATLDAPRATTSAIDGVTVVRSTQTLACLDVGCVPGSVPRVVRLPRARVGATLRSGGRSSAFGTRVGVTVSPRVPASAVGAATPPFRRQMTIPPPSFRASPRLLGAALWACAALLVLGAALVVEVERRRRHPARPPETVDELERAVRLARESASRGADDRRRAVGLLARVLGRRAARASAAEATRLAWSRPQPTAAAIEDAAADAERMAEARS